MSSLAELARYTYNMFRPPAVQTVSEWADQNRVLVSESSAEPGAWRTDRAPYQREIMDAFTQPGIWQIVIMASAQVGKSEIELNMMGCAIDNDPGPMLYIQPTDKVAEDYSKRRIQPMINACPTLREKVFKARSRDAANTITMKTFPGGSLAIIGANSPADLSSKPVRYIFMDETDRFPASAGTEGDPQELAERRTETFRHNRKIVKTSTPTIKGKSKIETDYMNGTQEEWHTECPHCHTFSYIRFADIHFEKEDYTNASGDEDYHVKLVTWRCPTCKRDIGEFEAKRLPAKWVQKNPRAIENGVRSFRLNAFMSPWSDWKDIVWKFLKAHKDPEKLKTFYNTILGETWEVHTNNGLDEQLYKRREHYDAEVPAGVLLLTMGMDTQDNRLEYEVVGWDREGQSWGINRGVIPGRADAPGVWQEVDALLDREWRMKNGMKMRIMATFIDSGGHHTSSIYKECARRASRRIWPIKGEKGEGKPECRPMKRGKAEGAAFMLGVDAGKEGIMYEAGIEEPGPHYMHFPIDYRAGYDMEYFKGLISERMEIHRKNGRGAIVWEQFYERNEPLDCRNYARAAYRYFNWQFDNLERIIRGEVEPQIITKKEETKRKQRHIVSRGIQV
jgi:phage terminase large subunit GpA-like protein